jgi:hypothetical protein
MRTCRLVMCPTRSAPICLRSRRQPGARLRTWTSGVKRSARPNDGEPWRLASLPKKLLSPPARERSANCPTIGPRFSERPHRHSTQRHAVDWASDMDFRRILTLPGGSRSLGNGGTAMHRPMQLVAPRVRRGMNSCWKWRSEPPRYMKCSKRRVRSSGAPCSITHCAWI